MEEQNLANTAQTQDQTPIAQPTETQKHSPVLQTILVIIILILVVVGGVLAYQNMKLTKELASLKVVPTPAASVNPIVTESPLATTDPTANWQIYTNTQYNFEIKYPSNYQALTDSTNMYGWPKAVVLIYKGGQSYDLPIEVWNTQAEYQAKYSFLSADDLKVFPTKDGKYITLTNANKSDEVRQIISTFKFTN